MRGEEKQVGDPSGPIRAAESDSPVAEDLALRLDRVMLRMRRVVAKPPVASLPIPALGHCVDFAKVMACMAVAETAGEGGTLASVKDIAADLQLEHSTASRLLSDAEADGLVRRRSDPRDRRRTSVTLTDEGRALVTESEAMRTRAIAAVFAAWDTADLEQLVVLLEQMVATLVDRMPRVVADLQADAEMGRPPC
jgi:DNA-binding MarR family transcriptional regulator